MKKLFAILSFSAALMAPLALTPRVSAEPPGEHREGHREIHAAIRALEQAKHRLEHADHDFGGHRREALEKCEQAINQLKLALQFDKE